MGGDAWVRMVANWRCDKSRFPATIEAVPAGTLTRPNSAADAGTVVVPDRTMGCQLYAEPPSLCLSYNCATIRSTLVPEPGAGLIVRFVTAVDRATYLPWLAMLSPWKTTIPADTSTDMFAPAPRAEGSRSAEVTTPSPDQTASAMVRICRAEKVMAVSPPTASSQTGVSKVI